MSPVAYQRVVAAIYADDRLRTNQAIASGVREFALALAYLEHCEPVPPPGGSVGRRLREILGSTRRVREALAGDLPCYRPPARLYAYGTSCLADMPRRGGLCGASPQWSYRHVHIRTGEWFQAGYCTRHRAAGEAARGANRAELEAAEKIPEPIPNHGGVLPGLLPKWDWEKMYAHVWKDWVPPVYGVVADRWPLVKQLHKVGKPKLAVIDGGGASDEACDGEPEPVVLQVIRP